jgi:hypothetical protein
MLVMVLTEATGIGRDSSAHRGSFNDLDAHCDDYVCVWRSGVPVPCAVVSDCSARSTSDGYRLKS